MELETIHHELAAFTRETLDRRVLNKVSLEGRTLVSNV
jgi:hypothetical protein